MDNDLSGKTSMTCEHR